MTCSDEPNPVAVLSADWHLCRSAWTWRRVRGDADFALEQTVDASLALGVPLIAAGDLFDDVHPGAEDVAAVRRQLGRMAAAGLPVYYVQGQHDRSPLPWLDAVAESVVHLDRRGVRLGGLRVVGLDWQPGSRLAEAVAAVAPGADVLVCHQVWSEFMGSAATAAGRTEGNLADVPCPLIVTGDYHCHFWRDVPTPGGGAVRAISPGAPHRLAIDEGDAFGVFVLADDGTLVDWPLAARPAIRHVIAHETDLVRWLDGGLDSALADAASYAEAAGLPTEVRPPLVRVQHPADLAGAADRLEAAVSGRGVLFRKPVAAPAEDDPADPAVLAALEAMEATGPSGLLAAVLPPSPGRDLLCRMAAADDPAAVLDQRCRDAGVTLARA